MLLLYDVKIKGYGLALVDHPYEFFGLVGCARVHVRTLLTKSACAQKTVHTLQIHMDGVLDWK